MIIIMMYFLLLFYSYYVLGNNEPFSDLTQYWGDSLNWYLFDVNHVPFYSLTLGFFRTISFDIFKPLGLMQLVTFINFIISIIFVYKTIFLINKNEKLALFSSFLFALWPCVGITQVVIPSADIVACSLFVSGIYFLHSKRIVYGSLLFGLSMLAHKVMWPFSFFILVVYLLNNFSLISNKKMALSFILYITPLVSLWICGSVYHSDPFWIISSNIKDNLSSNSDLIIFDGLLGPLIYYQSIDKVMKGLLVIGTFLLSGFLFKVAVKEKFIGWEISVGILLAIILLSIIVEQYEIWIIVRFGRLLVFPLAFYLVSLDKLPYSRFQTMIIKLGFIVLSLSQFLFMKYSNDYMSILFL